MGQIFYFLNKLRHRLWHTWVHAARIFADVAQGKWRPKSPKSFMLLAHNSTRLCLLEFFRLVCKTGIALAYYWSCRFLVMGAWSQSFTCALIDQTSAGGFDDIYRPFNHVPRAFSLFFWVGGRSEGEGALASTGHLIIKHPNINFLHSQFLTKRPRKEVVPEQDPKGIVGGGPSLNPDQVWLERLTHSYTMLTGFRWENLFILSLSRGVHCF